MFPLFFSGSTLSQGFRKILCITSLWLVMAPHYSQYHFDPFFDFIFKSSFTQFILYFLTSLKIIIIIISGCCFLQGAFLEDALLEGAVLEGALLERCVFRGCSFRGVRFQRGAQKQESRKNIETLCYLLLQNTIVLYLGRQRQCNHRKLYSCVQREKYNLSLLLFGNHRKHFLEKRLQLK